MGLIFQANLTGGPIPAQVYSDDDTARSWSRRMAAIRGAGILQVERFSSGGTAGLWFIDKSQQEFAYAYVARLFMPFKDEAVQFVTGVAEGSMTGGRDALVTMTLLTRGGLEIREHEEKAADGSIGSIDGWQFDPYDPEYDGIIMNTMADSEEWDSQFPNHPLSWLRTFMKELPDRITWPR